jgi:GTP-binding protein HflX
LLEKKKNKNHLEPERCVLVGLVTRNQDRAQLDEYLDELEFLALTAQAICVKRFTQNLDHPDSRTFVGKGKVEEIHEFVVNNEVDLVIFDDELSPAQLRNLENEMKGKKIIDRNNLILDIFASRARTAHARTQVELAQYQYLLPRLTKMWSHLEKQRGGIGMRGPGEQEIETDRRIVRDRISFLKKELATIDRQKQTQRGNRGNMVRVALVGYTNVGKSTIMNLLTHTDVLAENKLFATLDTTVRKVVLGTVPFLLTDTVGFIRKLPHQLIESFKSTLDETREADLLVHVLDIAHIAHEDHFNTVSQTLQEIGCGDKPVLMILNKIDLLPPTSNEMEPEKISFESVQKIWKERVGKDNVVFISATGRTHINELRKTLFTRVLHIHQTRYPNLLPENRIKDLLSFYSGEESTSS